MCGWILDTKHEVKVGHEQHNGARFGTAIHAIHKRAKKLLGLGAIAKEEFYQYESLFEEKLKKLEHILMQKEHNRKRQEAWDIYYGVSPLYGHLGR